MSGIRTQIRIRIQNQENITHNQENNQSMKTDTGMTQMLNQQIRKHICYYNCIPCVQKKSEHEKYKKHTQKNKKDPTQTFGDENYMSERKNTQDGITGLVNGRKKD